MRAADPSLGAAQVKRLLPVAVVLVALAAATWLWHAGAAAVPPSASPAAVAPRAGPATAAPTAAGTPSARGGALPPLDAPLQVTFAGLRARASGGDADAASRLFRDMARCRQWQAAQARHAQATVDLGRSDTGAMTTAELRTQQLLLDAAELRQRAVRDDRAFCAGVDAAMLDSLTADIARAAKLGDADARACYLGRGPLYDVRSLLAHPDSLRSYRNDATAMIRDGLAAGDWRVVDLLQQAYRPGAQMLLAAVVRADPLQHYRHLKLSRLGAEPHRAAALDRALVMAAVDLDSVQIAESDQWARRTLRRDFHGASTGPPPEGWEPCAF